MGDIDTQIKDAYFSGTRNASDNQSRRRRRFFKREARRTICDGNLLTLIFMSVFVLLVTVALKYLCGGFFAILDETVFTNLRLHKSVFYQYFSAYIGDILYVLIIVPLYYGIFSTAKRLYDRAVRRTPVGAGDVKAYIGDIFEPFSSGISLLGTYQVFFAYFWRYAMLGCIVLLGIFGSQYMFYFMLSYGSYSYAVLSACGISLAAVIIAVFGVIWLSRYYMVLFLSYKYPMCSLRTLVRASVRIMRGHKHECVYLQLSFIGWFLLGVLTLGAAFVIYVLPYILLTNVSYSSYLYDISHEITERLFGGDDSEIIEEYFDDTCDSRHSAEIPKENVVSNTNTNIH